MLTSCSSFKKVMMRSLPSTPPEDLDRVRILTVTSSSAAPRVTWIVKSS